VSTAVAPATSTRRVWPPVVALVAIMWAAELVDAVLPYDADRLGIESRSISGLLGIPLAPFLHGGFGHLMANTLPFVVLGLLVSWRAGSAFWPVVMTVVVGSGLGVWLLGPANTVTLGASALVFGFLTYLITAGFRTRHWIDVVVGIAVVIVYGSLLWGALPFFVAPGVSWLGHLCGAASGVLAAFLFAERRTPTA
jgi:membrane associated rhomboid family serine protease